MCSVLQKVDKFIRKTSVFYFDAFCLKMFAVEIQDVLTRLA